MTLSKKDLGKLIKEARRLKSKKINRLYTQQMLANDICKSQSYIGDIESGRTYPSFVLLNQIANACGVSIGFFQDSEILNQDIDKFIKLQLDGVPTDDVCRIREDIKHDPATNINYIYDFINSSEDNLSHLFRTPEEALKFILQQPALMNFCGIDIHKLSKEEISNFILDLLNQLKLVSYKYKNKS